MRWCYSIRALFVYLYHKELDLLNIILCFILAVKVKGNVELLYKMLDLEHIYLIYRITYIDFLTFN